MLRHVIKKINKTVDYRTINNTLSRSKLSDIQVVPNYHMLNMANKKNKEVLGDYYVGLNYDVKPILAGLISICEVFDINQVEIIIHLK